MRIFSREDGCKTITKCDPIKSGKVILFEEKGASV